MTPQKQKAKELVEKFYLLLGDYEKAKQCALIAVDEILNVHMWKYNSVEPFEFWKQVKTEIEQL